MELKIPPVIIFFVVGAFMYLLAEVLPVGYFNFFGRIYLGIGLIILAVSIGLIAVIQLYMAKTTIHPAQPVKTRKLIENGIYSYSRNPMYLALLMLLLAWGIWLGNVFNTLLAAGFVSYMNRFQILPEERALKQTFGKKYKQYCLLARRWF